MLEHQIHSKEHSYKQQLTYAGKQLAGNCTLEEYNIQRVYTLLGVLLEPCFTISVQYAFEGNCELKRVSATHTIYIPQT